MAPSGGAWSTRQPRLYCDRYVAYYGYTMKTLSGRPARPGRGRPGGASPRALARALSLAIAALTLLGSSLSASAAGDICEGRSGPELIRCIEAAARGAPQPPIAGKTAVPAPPAPPPSARAAEPARPPAADCTGKAGEQLRACLASGGRLAPAAATEAPAAVAVPAPSVQPADRCDGRTGDDAKKCIEAAAKQPATQPTGPQVLNCTRYHVSDQRLCLHRNTALIECRNRQKYPDTATCLRGFMASAPEPDRADCTNAGAKAKAQCEARNRVYTACRTDRMSYFDCLEQKLGPDAYANR